MLELAPGVLARPLLTPTLPPATHTNCYVLGSAELIVVDPATPHRDEQRALRQALEAQCLRGARVREIWLTHHHVDHVGAAGFLAEAFGVGIAAHAETESLLRGSVPVARRIEDGEVAALGGGQRVRALFTPGHAPGHLCFLDERSRYAVVGDMVASVGSIVIDPDEGDMAAYLASLARLRAAGAKVLLPAHGAPIEDPVGKIDQYVAHRRWREDKIFAAVVANAGATARELTTVAYDDVPTNLHPLARRSLLAHLHKLVADGRVCDAHGAFSPAS